MKVGFFLPSISVGGGNHLTKDFIENITRLQSKTVDVFLIVSDDIYIDFLIKKNLWWIFFKKSLIDRIFLRLFKIKRLSKFLKLVCIKNPLEKFLEKNTIDLLIFNSPDFHTLYSSDLNYVASIWNTEIRQYKNSTEFKDGGFEYQEKIIKEITKSAFKIVVFTNQNKLDLVRLYKCDPEKIILQNSRPILPKIHMNSVNKNKFLLDFENLNLDKKNKWIFYPAQFWEHKNHSYIIDALDEINYLGMSDINFVFCGKDRGYLSEIKLNIKRKDLENRFKFFDYLTDYQVISLYIYSDAVVIPTYLGRSSMPLLESFYFNKEIFYGSNVLDEKFYKYVNKIDLKRPEDFANKLNLFFKDNKKREKKINLRNVYKQECADDIFLNTYKKIIDDFSLNKK